MRVLVYLIIIIFIFSIVTLIKLEKHEVKYIKSDLDNKEYLVRDLKDKSDAANLLASLKINMMKLVDHLYQHKDSKDSKYSKNKKYIEQLKSRIENAVINESSEDSAYTSYSVNKGEQIVFCLRSKHDNKLHELNLLMYVAIHEMAHVGCPSYGHNDEFKHIFAFFTTIAIELGLYAKIDFHDDPIEYCGLVISESII